MAAGALGQVIPFPASNPIPQMRQLQQQVAQPAVTIGHNGGPDMEVDESRYLPVSRLKKQLQSYLGAKVGENDEAREADRYFHAVQWTSEEQQILKLRNQPPVTYNRIRRKVNMIVGIIEKARQDPKGFPTKPSPGAEDGAELSTKVLRYALGWDWQDKSSEVARKSTIRGISGVEMVLSPGENGDPDVELDEVDQREYFYDPRSGKRDFSDARFHGTERWVDVDEAEDTWPDSAEELRGLMENAPGNWERGDERLNHAWFNRSEQQVRIVDHWYVRGGTWYYCIYCGDVVLEQGVSPFRDHKKRSISKFIMMSCEVDHENDRYGFFRDWKGPQDEINHRRSKALHSLNNRKIIMDKGAVDDVDLTRREAARADGVLVKNKGYELQFAENTADVQGNLEMLQEAKNEIDTYGPNPGLIGSDVDPSSGRAIKMLQAAGIAELGTFMMTYRHWKLRVYRAVWCACQQFWTGERWIGVTGQEGLPEFIQVNGWQRDEHGFPVIINQLAQLDVDIVLDEGPDTINTMEDTFDLLINLASKGAQVPPSVIIELSSLPSTTKKRVMQLLQQGEQPDPMQLQGLQLKLQDIMADIQKKQASATLDQARAAEIGQGSGGAGQQIDTPADIAKARLDLARAAEIEHRINGGGDRPPTMFDIAEQQARTRATHAKADETQARAGQATIELRNLAQYGAREPGRIRPPTPAPAAV